MGNARLIAEPCPTCGKPRKRVNGRYLRDRRETAQIGLNVFARDYAKLSAGYISDVERNRRNATKNLIALYESLGS